MKKSVSKQRKGSFGNIGSAAFELKCKLIDQYRRWMMLDCEKQLGLEIIFVVVVVIIFGVAVVVASRRANGVAVGVAFGVAFGVFVFGYVIYL